MIDYLERAATLYYLDPGHALWRSTEAALLASWEFKSPVLEVGCGDGLFAYLLLAKNILDLDQYKFHHARLSAESFQFHRRIEAAFDLDTGTISKAHRLRVYKTLAVADACRLPYPKEVFATVFSNCVIEHIPDLQTTLSEIARVLKPGGFFLTTVPSERFGDFLVFTSLFRKLGLSWVAEAYIHWFNKKLQHFHTISPQSWQRHLENAGFRLVNHFYYIPERTEWAWSVCWLFLHFGWKQWTIGALIRQFIYMLHAAHIEFHKHFLKTLWIKILRPYTGERGLPPEGNGGALFLVSQKIGDPVGINKNSKSNSAA